MPKVTNTINGSGNSYSPTIHPWNQQLWQSLTLESGRSNHALLFNGDIGLGKQDLAFSLAHFVLTQSQGQSLSLFDAGSHPDLHIIMPEAFVGDNLLDQYAQRYLQTHGGKPRANITIDQIRTLNGTLTTHPHIAQNRIILIMHADTMNRNAANALLKSLEEPPSNTLFILVSNEVSKLAKTVRSRCSLINFTAPDYEHGHAWLSAQGDLAKTDIDSHLAMANNSPLLALQMYENDYLSALKSVFTDVNNLWTQRTEATQVAKSWQDVGSLKSIDILQKLSTDILRCTLSENPSSVFFPVQKSWVQSVAPKLSITKLLDAIDELIYAKRLLSTTVDELLVLETVSIKFSRLPI